MRSYRPSALAFAVSLWASSTATANHSRDPTRIGFDVPRADVVMGDDIARTQWPARLAHPSKEGQFEVLVRKTATPILAPACHSEYLVIRMPASLGTADALAIQAAIGQKTHEFDSMMVDYANGRPLHFDVFAATYGRRAANGRLILTGCNLFFQEPASPRR